MAKVCQVTGAKARRGGTISHSHRRGKRWFRPNLQRKRFWVPSQRRWITLTLSAKGIRTISHKGIESVLADMRRRGERV